MSKFRYFKATMPKKDRPQQIDFTQNRCKSCTLQIFRLFRYSYPSSSLRCSLVASARLCCLSRVPPAVCPSLLKSATTGRTSFLQSLSTYVRTPTPHSILRFRPAPQTPDLHTSNLPLFFKNLPQILRSGQFLKK